MLVVSRKANETLGMVINRESLKDLQRIVDEHGEVAIDVFVVFARGGTTRLGITAPRAVKILRPELAKKKGAS